MSLLSESIEIAKKDIRSEIRTRYNIIAIALFIVTSVTTIIFSIGDEALTPEISAGLLWILMLYGSMTGLSRCFVSEEERGTRLLLQLTTRPLAVFFGKLLYNFLLGTFLNSIAIILFMLFTASDINSILYLIIAALLATIGLSSASTIISAIISQANGRGVLFPVLVFPILLPVIFSGIEMTVDVFAKTVQQFNIDMVLVSVSYSIILVTISSMLFEFVWGE